MKLFFLLLSFASFQADVPYKPSDEFQVNIELSYKAKKPAYAPSTYTESGEALDRVNSTPLPFLNVSVAQIKIQSDEVKIIAIDSQGVFLTRKKVSPGLVLRFEMGFVEDIRSKAVNHEVTLYFLSKGKKKLRKIVFSVAGNGAFEVNGKSHGQF